MGGSPKQPEIRYMPALPSPAPVAAPPPKIAPIPSPTSSKVSAQATAESRRKRIAAARYGILSTIKTGPLGIVGAGADLGPSGAGKRTFG